MPYEVRYAYTSATTLGEAEVRSRHEQIDEAAEAFVRCTAPFKQIIWSDDDGPDFLDPAEERRLAEVCGRHGYDVEEVEG
jgi:hypothetical protein